MLADLHIHSIFSDSTRSPEDIVQIAKDKQISLISICDHYTIDSYERLTCACESNNISCVLGIEMDANMNGKNYHVLAYNFDRSNMAFIDFIKHQYLKNQKECKAMIAKMCNDYSHLSLLDYDRYEMPKELGGWKYIHYAVNKGVFSTYREASKIIYSTYYKAGEETYPIDEFCRLVRQANGVSVFAHPGNYDSDNLIALFEEMQGYGIQGIECFYPSHSKKTTEICLEYCRKNNLRITCGSDCHGDYDKTEGFAIGSFQTSIDLLDLKGIVNQ